MSAIVSGTFLQLSRLNPEYSQNIKEREWTEEVATRRALRDGQPPEKILRMLEHSPQYKSCKRQYGTENARKLAEDILKFAVRNSRQEAVEFSKSVSELLNELGAGERQADGSLLLKGKSFNYRQHTRTISLIANDGRGEIFRVTDGQVALDKRTDIDMEKCHGIQKRINEDILERANKELSHKKKPEQQQDRGISL